MIIKQSKGVTSILEALIEGLGLKESNEPYPSGIPKDIFFIYSIIFINIILNIKKIYI